ncbi:hypothetical protein I6B53_02230 [Schaalia sp. 19OD2882]|uniref:plasmid mobilization protein n=1 Tax=Schaalia sp. 19OD2882 TaxID=2794089 RepID=UPI001C1EF8C7|nr:hypothetical protein [Schaalia sp. 19OD2882]QWW19951.1 hypothetical protein I6B53_02230 [Schaalia sp. 19OD2882]
MTVFDASLLGGSKGAGTDPLGQHDEASAESSAGRSAVPPKSSSRNGASDKDARYQPEVTTTDGLAERVRGGDLRIARRQSRDTRVTVRFSDEERTQLARVARRYGLSESGAIRAAVDMLDGSAPPKAINRDVLRLIGEVNAVGVNVNQLTCQGWAGTAPAVAHLDEATTALLRVAKELA